jgi:chlorophyll synthase
MARATTTALAPERAQWTAFVELLKPITWFPPMWAYGCGLIASGQPLFDRLPFALAGIALAGPLVCGTSQVVNDWFDRDVDAINEPQRPIPSGRVSVRAGLVFAITWTCLSLLVAAMLGAWVTIAAGVGLALAWAYSAPPFRLKQNGWYGNAAVGLCYEGLPWFTAAAVMTASLPSSHSLLLALLYSVGAHGIMTLNDFKAIGGDRQMGIRSLPVQLGARGAAWLACIVMAVPQAIVIALLLAWEQMPVAAIVAGLLLAQLTLMTRFLRDPVRFATWYSALGVSLYVLGMLDSAFAVRGIIGS